MQPLPLSDNHEELAEGIFIRRDDGGGLWLMTHEDGEVEDVIYLDPAAVDKLMDILKAD